MELLSGPTVHQWAKEGPSVPAIIRTFVEAGDGLAAAHGAGVLHRDVKPSNLMFDASGRIRVVDFGLGRLLEGTGAVTQTTLRRIAGRDRLRPVGTPAYMAPEIHEATPGSPHADQYAFAAALFEALHGRPPFPGRTLEDIQRMKVRAEPDFDRRRFSSALRTTIRTGLSPYPDDRHRDMSEFLVALRHTPECSGRRRSWWTRWVDRRRS